MHKTIGIEEKVSKAVKKSKIQDALLFSLYATVGLALVVTAPNALSLFKFLPGARTKEHLHQKISQACSRLVSRGLIERSTSKDGKKQLTLTQKGTRHVQALLQSSKYATVEIPKRWDGKWRLVIFDIWESRRSVRDALRSRLKTTGFIPIQNSVWAFPYDCEELLFLLRTELRLGKSVLYVVAEGVENDIWLRKHFKVSL